MISEAAQEQATLYALNLLDADEAAVFQRELDADPKLRELVAELRETVAALATTAEGEPPRALKAAVMARVAADRSRQSQEPSRPGGDPAPGKVVTGPWRTWLPWALAATLMLCCGALEFSREQWRQKFFALDQTAADTRIALERVKATARPVPVDALQQVAFCPLEPMPQATAQPQAAVLWDAAHRVGKLRLQRLPPPGEGHDYQLWVVETGRKETVSAGVVTVTDGKTLEVDFQPVPQGGTEPVVAFALSLERAGGSPTNQGPILFLGKL